MENYLFIIMALNYLYLLFVQCTLFSILVELMWQTNQYEITRPTSESTDSFIGWSQLKSLSASELFWSLKVRKCLKTHATTCKSFSLEDSWTNVVTSRSPVTALMECFDLTTGDRYKVILLLEEHFVSMFSCWPTYYKRLLT